MIITKTPFRVSFVGGGSDLPAFYTKSPGAVLSSTINKYMYLTVHPYWHSGKYHIPVHQGTSSAPEAVLALKEGQVPKEARHKYERTYA